MPYAKFVRLALAAALLIAANPADAQRAIRGVPQAFAVVQAPESAVEACHAATARAAHDCALAKCQKKAGKAGACFAATVCAPSGWAGIMGVQLKEAHFSETVCGAPSREAALDALKAFCRGHLSSLRSCSVSLLWGPDGKPDQVNVTWSPGDLQK